MLRRPQTTGARENEATNRQAAPCTERFDSLAFDCDVSLGGHAIVEPLAVGRSDRPGQGRLLER